MDTTMRFANQGIPAGAAVTVIARATGGRAETIVRFEGRTVRVDPLAVD